MTHEYSIGDRVRIKKDLTFGLFNGICVVEEMLEYRGKTTTITKIKLVSIELGIDGGKWAWTEDMLEPVTKSLEELEVNNVVKNEYYKMKVVEVKHRTIYRCTNQEGKTKNWSIEALERMGYQPYTPKKITVFKHKGKRYPVSEIIKKVKSL